MLRASRLIPKIGLSVAAGNQKKNFYFHFLIYWHEGLFLPRVFCADDSLGEAPKCHVPWADRNSWLYEDRASVSREFSHSRNPQLLSEASTAALRLTRGQLTVTSELLARRWSYPAWDFI